MPRSQQLLDPLRQYVGAEYQSLFLDELYCLVANGGNELSGNSASGDVEWFAQRLYADLYPIRSDRHPHWEALPEDERRHWRYVTQMCLQLLPLFAGRVASRWQATAVAVEAVLRGQRAEARRAGEALTAPWLRRARGEGRAEEGDDETRI